MGLIVGSRDEYDPNLGLPERAIGASATPFNLSAPKLIRVISTCALALLSIASSAFIGWTKASSAQRCDGQVARCCVVVSY
jgi:hypothetical protein